MNKTALVILALLGTVSALAQTNTPVLITNMVTAHPDFRRVNGQLYNIRKSRLWRPISGKCAGVSSEGIKLQTYTTNKVLEQWYARPSGGSSVYSGEGGVRHQRLVSGGRIPDKRIFIKNYSTGYHAAEGQEIAALLMQTGTVEVDGETLELWDFGTPNVVSVVTTNHPAR